MLCINANEFSFPAFVFKLYETLDQCEQSIIFTTADVFAGLPFGAALTCKNIAAEYVLAAELL